MITGFARGVTRFLIVGWLVVSIWGNRYVALAQAEGVVVVAAGDSAGVAQAIRAANFARKDAAPLKIFLQAGAYSFATDAGPKRIVLPDIARQVVIFGQNTEIDLDVTTLTRRAPINILSGAHVEFYNLVFLVKMGVGRAIANMGTLHISDSRFGSDAGTLNGGGIENRGALIMDRTAFVRVGYVSSSEPGGAIFNSGGMSVDCSRFVGNIATKGGAIYITGGGQTRLSQSAFSDNRANGGGAIFNATQTLVDAANNWWKGGAPKVENTYLGIDSISTGVNSLPIAQQDPTQTDICRPRQPLALPKT